MLTDVSFCLTFLGVLIGFGGRAALGQLVLVTGTVLTATLWILHQWTSRQVTYQWSGSELFWLGGIAVAVSQVMHLPDEWLTRLAPNLSTTLPLWFDANRPKIVSSGWHQLSLAPWETLSGLAVFLAYAILFLVMTQRVASESDVKRVMMSVCLATVGMALFAQIQYWASNGKFFWVYTHPFMTTDSTPHGCFTNHNHLAQFLALGIGPLIWSLLRSLKSSTTSSSGFGESTSTGRPIGVLASLFGLGLIIVTILSTSSRGGLLAAAVAVSVCVAVLWRLKQVSATLFVGLILLASAIGAICNFSGSESSLAARLGSDSGREHIWKANLAVARDFPILGTGVGTHADAHQMHLDRPVEGVEYSHAESGYLQVLSETGYVGFGVAMLFMITSCWWCLRGLFHSDPELSSLSAAVSASLFANLFHAVGDFFWYTPLCMILLGLQLICVSRVSRLARGDIDRVIGQWKLHRVTLLPVTAGLVLASAWMIQVKLPEAMAEPDYMALAEISQRERDDYSDDEEYRASRQEKHRVAIRAARLNPSNARMQEHAAFALIERFNDRQEQSENPLSVTHLRDAVNASQFESRKALNDWLKRGVGPNTKYLRAASVTFQRSLNLSPLRADSYVKVAELNFLDQKNSDLENACLEQALKLRPHDPETTFSVGKLVLIDGNLERAMELWKEAFRHSIQLRMTITELLIGQVTSEFLIEKFEPDWPATYYLARSFSHVGRDDDAGKMWNHLISIGRDRLKSSLSDDELESTVLMMNTAFLSRGERNHSVSMMTQSLKRLPYSFPVRFELGKNLLEQRRYLEASKHLKWCLTSQPDNQELIPLVNEAARKELSSEPNSPVQLSRATKIEME